MLPHSGKLGHCTVPGASANPVMIENVVVTNGQLLSVLSRNGGDPNMFLYINNDPSKNMFSSLSVKYSTGPETKIHPDI